MARDDFRLPAGVVGPADLIRLKRGLETLDDQQHQAALRAKAGSPSEPIRPGGLLAELATLNDSDLQVAADRASLLEALESTLKSAPTVTMSFAVDPSAAFMAKIVAWLRTNTNPMLLVRVGLQPNIAAGCTIRTPSKVYDFSLRSKFAAQRPMLVERLRQSSKPKLELQAPTVAAPAPITPAPKTTDNKVSA